MSHICRQESLQQAVMCQHVHIQMRELDLSTMEWRRVDAKGQPPPFRLHSSAAVVADKWIIHGGRRNGKFNVTNDTSVFDFNTLRQATPAC